MDPRTDIFGNSCRRQNQNSANSEIAALETGNRDSGPAETSSGEKIGSGLTVLQYPDGVRTLNPDDSDEMPPLADTSSDDSLSDDSSTDESDDEPNSDRICGPDGKLPLLRNPFPPASSG